MSVVTISKLSHEKRKSLATAGLKMFFYLADEWKLNVKQVMLLLGQYDEEKVKMWSEKHANMWNIELSADTIERLSLIASIRKSIETLYPKERWNDCITRPNRFFGNRSLLDRMLDGNIRDLLDVRDYLNRSL